MDIKIFRKIMAGTKYSVTRFLINFRSFSDFKLIENFTLICHKPESFAFLLFAILKYIQ